MDISVELDVNRSSKEASKQARMTSCGYETFCLCTNWNKHTGKTPVLVGMYKKNEAGLKKEIERLMFQVLSSQLNVLYYEEHFQTKSTSSHAKRKCWPCAIPASIPSHLPWPLHLVQRLPRSRVQYSNRPQSYCQTCSIPWGSPAPHCR